MVESSIKLGIVGARGHTGAELIALVANHPRFELAFVSSRCPTGMPLHVSPPTTPRASTRSSSTSPRTSASMTTGITACRN